MEAGSDLISKLKERHKVMTETIDNEIAFVLNLCKELDINVDDIMKEDDPWHPNCVSFIRFLFFSQKSLLFYELLTYKVFRPKRFK